MMVWSQATPEKILEGQAQLFEVTGSMILCHWSDLFTTVLFMNFPAFFFELSFYLAIILQYLSLALPHRLAVSCIFSFKFFHHVK